MLLRIPLTIIATLLLTPLLRAQEKVELPVEAIFTQEMTKADLERIEKEMADKGIELKIDDADFRDGRLHAISFSVKTAIGSGTASGEITPDTRYGFRYDPRPGVEVPFAVGNLSTTSGPER
jgi:hypothetical protein